MKWEAELTAYYWRPWWSFIFSSYTTGQPDWLTSSSSLAQQVEHCCPLLLSSSVLQCQRSAHLIAKLLKNTFIRTKQPWMPAAISLSKHLIQCNYTWANDVSVLLLLFPAQGSSSGIIISCWRQNMLLLICQDEFNQPGLAPLLSQCKMNCVMKGCEGEVLNNTNWYRLQYILWMLVMFIPRKQICGCPAVHGVHVWILGFSWTEFSSVHILEGVLAQLSNRAMSFSPVC